MRDMWMLEIITENDLYPIISGGGAHWALEHRYVTLLPKQVISGSNDPKSFNLILKIIKVAPQMFQRFMFCVSEIFLENFDTFSLKCSSFSNFLARKMFFF